MIRKKYILIIQIILFLCIINSNLIAVETGKLSGYIFDKSTNQPIPDANIIIEDLNLGTYSLSDGFYYLTNLPKKSYDITYSVIGYKQATEKISIKDNTNVDIYLIPEIIQGDPVIITATRSNRLQSEVTASTEIITKSDLNEKNGDTVGEILQSTNGIHVNRYGSLAGMQNLSIRGSISDQVLVLLDGQPLNTSQGGGVDLSNIPIEGIEKIEVIKGGHSALFGSYAVGGVVNIISDNIIPEKGYQYSIKTTQGSFGLQKYAFYGLQRVDNLDLFLNYNNIQSKGDYQYSPASMSNKVKRENNNYESNNIFFKANYNMNSNSRIQSTYQTFLNKRGVSGSTSWPSLYASRNEKRHMCSISSENRLNELIYLQGKVFYHLYNNHYKDDDPNAWDGPTDDKHKTMIYGGSAQTILTPNSYMTVTSGIEYQEENLNSTKVDNRKRSTESIFIQSEFNYDLPIMNKSLIDSKIIPAIRWDKYSKLKDHFSPKLGVLFNTKMSGFKIGVLANIGKSFRVPSFNDLYWPSSGNEYLVPEKSINFDYGIYLNLLQNYNLQFKSNYFQNSIKDLIIWQPTLSGWQPMNIGKALIYGYENSIKYISPGSLYNIGMSYTRTNAFDKTNPKATVITYRPKNKIDINAGINYASILFNLNYTYVSRRYTSADNKNYIPSYTLVGSNIGYTFNIKQVKLETNLQIFNLMDKSITIIDGYPIPGREFRFSIGISY